MPHATHTPPPWNRAEIMRGKYAGSIGIYPADRTAPAFAILPRGRQDIQAANAALIAAAPLLLAAVKNARALLATYGDNEAADRALEILTPALDEATKPE